MRTKPVPLFLLAAAWLIVASSAFANEPGTCPPAGSPPVGPTPPYRLHRQWSPELRRLLGDEQRQLLEWL